MANSSFGNAVDDAIARLKVQEACPKHKWATPKRNIWRHGKVRTELFATTCNLCGARASRPTIEQLKAEVMGL